MFDDRDVTMQVHGIALSQSHVAMHGETAVSQSHVAMHDETPSGNRKPSAGHGPRTVKFFDKKKKIHPKQGHPLKIASPLCQ